MGSQMSASDIVAKHKALLLFSGSCMSWIFSVLSLSKCRFMTSSQGDLGLISRPYVDDYGEYLGCVKYGVDDDNDSGLKLGRAFGIITSFCISVSLAILVYSALLGSARVILWKFAHCSMAAAAFSQMVVFAALSSKQCLGDCKLAGVGILAVFNTILLDILCLVWFNVPAPSTKRIDWNHVKQENETTASPSTHNKTLSVADSSGPKDEAVSVESGDTHASHDSPEHFGCIQDLIVFRLTTVLLIGIVWVASLVGVRRCTFLEKGFDSQDQSNFSGLGLYAQAIYEDDDFMGCVAYSITAIEDFDGSFRTARAFGAITSLLTSVVALLSVLQLIQRRYLQQCWYCFRVLVPTVTCAQLVTLAALDSDVCKLQGENECRLGGTGILVLLNIFLSAVLSAVVLVVPPPRCTVFVLHLSTPESDIPDGGVERESLPIRISPVPRERIDPARTRTSCSECDGQSATDSVEQKIRPPDVRIVCPSTSGDSDVSSVVVTIEHTRTAKKTVKVVTYVDGSKTVTTTIEEE
jgi:hypothetical protein